MANPTVVRNVANATMPIIDQVRIGLQKFGKNEVYFNLKDWATQLNIRPLSVYQALYRLQKMGEVEILTKPRFDSGRGSIIEGAILKKMEAPANTIERALTKPVNTARLTRKTVANLQDQIPDLMAYHNKKQVVENIRMQLAEAGFNPEEVLQLPAESAIAEQGLLCFDKWREAQAQIAELETRMELLSRVKVVEIEPEREPITVLP